MSEQAHLFALAGGQDPASPTVCPGVTPAVRAVLDQRGPIPACVQNGRYDILGMGPVTAGLTLVPMALAFFGASMAGPRMVARFGSRVVTVGGVVQAAGITLLLATLRHGWPDLGPGALAPGVFLAGLGQGLQLPVLMRLMLSDVPADRAGVGSGVVITTQQSALALGVAALGSLFLALAPTAGPREAVATALLVQLALIALTVLLSLRLPRMR
ncbi:hypothetical protein [Streptomyces sp. MB09-01]|uniref:hypothetical protein n=1 Tax=Streptomyces sp. MB09-01 TaxID=3028666 RepID=UPI003A5C0C33